MFLVPMDSPSLLLLPMDSLSLQQVTNSNSLQYLLSAQRSQVMQTVCSILAMIGSTAQMAGESVFLQLQQVTSHLQQSWSSDVPQLLVSYTRSEYLSLSNLSQSQLLHTMYLSSRGTNQSPQLLSNRSCSVSLLLMI